jgi:hypothetical protein
VKNDKGVKIYFDVVSTARRGEQAKQLMAKVLFSFITKYKYKSTVKSV